jgi:hypothetical protein
MKLNCIFHSNRTPFILLLLAIAALSAAADQSTPVRYKPGAFIKDWLICGPFPNCEDCPLTDYKHSARCKGFYTDYLTSAGGEKSVIPHPGMTVRVPEKNIERHWFTYHSAADLIPLNDIVSPNDMVVVYAFCQISTPAEIKSILSVGSNDGIQVFLNGKKIHENHPKNGRWLQKDNDFIPVDLKAGTNNLLLKIDEGGGDFGFVARFLNYDSTLAAIRKNIDSYKTLTLVAYEDSLKASFGEPYKISALNPDSEVKIELIHEKAGKLAELSGAPGVEVAFPMDKVPEGFYLARASFKTAHDGTIVSETRSYKGKLARHAKVSRLGGHLFPLNGEGHPFFPIGTYGAPVGDYGILRDAGYNFVVADTADLDSVYKAGLLAAVPLHGGKPDWFSAVRYTIEKFKHHPAVLCWMLYDEPGYNRADLLDIYQLYQTAYQADPDHPSYLVITNPSVYKTFGYCCDVLAVDTYPVAGGDITSVGGNIAKAIREIPEDLPVWHCGQLFAWPAQRKPNIQEHRFMTYAALIEGARGLLWYTYKGYNQSLPDDDPALWDYHKKLLAEISTLSEAFMEGKSSLKISLVKENEDIRYRYLESAYGNYLLVANQSSTLALTPLFKLPGGVTGKISVIGEGRFVDIINYQFTDTFNPLDVHIYKLP